MMPKRKSIRKQNNRTTKWNQKRRTFAKQAHAQTRHQMAALFSDESQVVSAYLKIYLQNQDETVLSGTSTTKQLITKCNHIGHQPWSIRRTKMTKSSPCGLFEIHGGRAQLLQVLGQLLGALLQLQKLLGNSDLNKSKQCFA